MLRKITSKTVTVEWDPPKFMTDVQEERLLAFFNSIGVGQADKFAYQSSDTNTQIINRIMAAADSFGGVVKHVKIRG